MRSLGTISSHCTENPVEIADVCVFEPMSKLIQFDLVAVLLDKIFSFSGKQQKSGRQDCGRCSTSLFLRLG